MTRAITPRDLWTMHRVGQPEHIPGTTSVVVPVVDYHDEDGGERGVLHSVDRHGLSTPLTDRSLDAGSPMPSPDGSTIAFLAAADGEDHKQIYTMASDGSDITQVCAFPLGAKAVHWIPGASALVAAVPLKRDHLSIEATTSHIEEQLGKTEPVVTEDRLYRHWNRWLAGQSIEHLFRVDVDTGLATDLTPDITTLIALEDLGSAYAVTPDGQSVIFTLDVGEPEWHVTRFMLHMVDTKGGPIRRIASNDAVRQARPRVSPDGSTVVYGAQHEHGYYADLVHMVSLHLATGVEYTLTPGWDRSAGGWEFIDNDSVIFHAEDEGRVRLFTATIEGDQPMPITGAGSNHGPRVGLDCFWHRSESMHRPPEVAVTSGGRTQPVSQFNAELLGELDLRPAEEIRFEGSEARSIQAFVVEPPGFSTNEQWPLLHSVHGGPHNAIMDSWLWRWNPQVMAASGRVVAMVNFHGSSSFGDEFARSIHGAWGDLPSRDIEAATDYLIGLGFIDENRMAIAGGSYGGYLVTWITTQTDRYQASICHAGVTDLLGQWASDLTEGREKAAGGVPWEDMDAVQRWSPMAHTHNITTPTLVIHGEVDFRVVNTQGLELYGMLKHKGVPSRLMYFSDEGHWIEKQQNAMVWWDEFLAWLTRWSV